VIHIEQGELVGKVAMQIFRLCYLGTCSSHFQIQLEFFFWSVLVCFCMISKIFVSLVHGFELKLFAINFQIRNSSVGQS